MKSRLSTESRLRPTSAVGVRTAALTRGVTVLGVLIVLVDVYFLWPRSSAEYTTVQRPASPANLLQQHKIQAPHNLSSNRSQRRRGKTPIVNILLEAGVTVDNTLLQKLPSWEQVSSLYGESPVLVGLSSCASFRSKIPEARRMIGAAGMFSTGTNLVTQLLKQNCQIPARVALYGPNATKEQHGMRWQVPWGKHTDLTFREAHSTAKAKDINKNDILPVVTIRNPWRWMQSMCKNWYSARWEHRNQCPNLKKTPSTWNNVTVTYGAGVKSYQSLVHLWNEWYTAYTVVDFPLLMVRMEDLVVHTKVTISSICECAGGRIRSDRPFTYIVESAKKDSPGHDTSIGLAEAIIKYSQPLQVEAGFTHDDYEAAYETIGQQLMDAFGYYHPPTASAG